MISSTSVLFEFYNTGLKQTVRKDSELIYRIYLIVRNQPFTFCVIFDVRYGFFGFTDLKVLTPLQKTVPRLVMPL